MINTDVKNHTNTQKMLKKQKFESYMANDNGRFLA